MRRKRILLGYFECHRKRTDESTHSAQELLPFSEIFVWLEQVNFYDGVQYQIFFTDVFAHPIALGLILSNIHTQPISMYGISPRQAYVKYRIIFEKSLEDYESIAEAIKFLKNFKAESKLGRIRFVLKKNADVKIQGLFLAENL